MSDTTNQMSLLDAIGLGAPEETKKKKEPANKAEEKSASKKKRKQKKLAEKPEPVTASDEPNANEIDEVGLAEREDVTIPEGTPLEISGDGTLPLDKHLCFALYSANHAMHSVYKTLLKEVGLTYPQFLAMTVLWDKNNVPVGAITSKLQLDTNTLTPLLKRLETMELLTRTRSTKDERQVILKLTRKGKNLQKKTQHFNQCIFSSTGFNLQEIADLQQKVMKLRDNLRDAGLS